MATRVRIGKMQASVLSSTEAGQSGPLRWVRAGTHELTGDQLSDLRWEAWQQSRQLPDDDYTRREIASMKRLLDQIGEPQKGVDYD